MWIKISNIFEVGVSSI